MQRRGLVSGKDMENALKDTVKFYPGFDLRATTDRLGFSYGKNVFGPVPEIRRLDDIRISLQDPLSSRPEELYAIVMDVGLNADREEIVKRNLLFGAVEMEEKLCIYRGRAH